MNKWINIVKHVQNKPAGIFDDSQMTLLREFNTLLYVELQSFQHRPLFSSTKQCPQNHNEPHTQHQQLVIFFTAVNAMEINLPFPRSQNVN